MGTTARRKKTTAKVGKTADLHESTVKNAATIQAGFAEFKSQMEAFGKVLSPSDKKLNRKYSKVTKVTLHPLILAFVKEHGLSCNDFIVEGPESIRLKEKWDV